MRQGYGLTEAGPNCFSLPTEDAIRKQGSIGFPNFYIGARLVKEDGTEAGVDEVGELWMKGPHVFAGYWGNAEQTAEVLHDGWLSTGDLMTRDADGYYFHVGRKKDMYVSGGENVYPAQIERVLQRHEAVALAAVVGVPDPKWGETGWAFVKLLAGSFGGRTRAHLMVYAAYGCLPVSNENRRDERVPNGSLRQGRQAQVGKSGGHHDRAMNDSIRHLPGIDVKRVRTSRLATQVLVSGPENGEPVLFLHGNFSSSTFWEETMLALPERFRGFAPDQRGYGLSDRTARIDATRGFGDWADDVTALADTLDWGQIPSCGPQPGWMCGLGSGWQPAAAPEKRHTCASPGPPCGFGGARGERGELELRGRRWFWCWPGPSRTRAPAEPGRAGYVG